ncbi:phospholipase-like protein [Tanacetum coccineum]|uniref:Phospholipase-like protein n=1 Tax=Tanacetum coccineum TaxID=301880 RepID=A0ABQ5GUR7_9ASTR
MFPTPASHSFFEGAQETPSYDQHMSSWYPSSHPATSKIMTPRPQQGFFQWSSLYQATVYPRGKCGSSHNHDVGGVIPSPYTNFLNTTVAPKKRSDKSKNMARNAKVPAFVLGNAVVDDNLVDDEVMITGARATDEYIWYTNVDPNNVKREQYEECMTFNSSTNPIMFFYYHIKGYRVMELFSREPVPDLYMGGYYKVDDAHNACWLSDDQINCWMELVIRNRPYVARFRMEKARIASKHLGSQMFVIEMNEHIKGTLDGSTRPYPSWDDVDWVYMPINARGNHWNTIVLLLHLIRRRREEERINHLKQDQGVKVEEVVVGEGVVVTSSSLEMLTNSCLGGIMVNLIFLKRFKEEALVEFMVEIG